MELHVCNLNLRRVVPSLTFIMPLAEITGVPAFLMSKYHMLIRKLLLIFIDKIYYF